jgi:hypothetical protein
LQAVPLIESVCDACPPGPELLQLLLDQAARRPADWGWACWLLPLAAAAACGGGPGAPPAPAAAWAGLVQLAQRVSRSAARALAERALQAQPWDVGLMRLALDLD